MSGIVGGLNTRGSGLILSSATDGQVLTATGAGMSAGFEAISSGGKILQVVSDDLLSTTSTTSTTFTALSGLSATITPAATSSKILILGHLNIYHSEGTYAMAVRLMRASTAIIIADAGGSSQPRATFHGRRQHANNPNSVSVAYVDSPSTTSSTAYTWEWYTEGATLYCNRTGTDTDSLTYPRVSSTIMAIEIGA